METDRELLELAAKAAGHNWKDWTATLFAGESKMCEWPYDWNPLTDDGDALRLSVKLGIEYGFGFTPGTDDEIACVGNFVTESTFVKHTNNDPYAATRRTIVRAAASIGKGMP